MEDILVIRIAFDIGGVISKYPDVFQSIIDAFEFADNNDIVPYIISDIHPKEKILAMLRLNNIIIPADRVHSADYNKYGEACKAELCKQLEIDVLVDDFIGYVAPDGAPIRLLVMPDASRPYYANEWKTDGSEGDFGRRKHSAI